jgi:nucleoporin SEH1
LGDARRAVTSVAFSPRHHGLKLAAGSADGCIRIYEAIDVISVGSWPLQACLQLYGGAAAADDAAAATSPSPASSSSAASHWLTLSWCNGRFDPPTLVVGGGGAPPTAGVVASVVAATASTVALAAAAGGAGGGGGPEASSPDIPPHPPSSSPAPGLQSLVVVRYVESARSWLPIRVLNSGTPVGAAPRISRPATCVAWAPNVGRRYHYVAAAHGTSLIIYRLARGGSRSTSSSDRSTAAGGGGLGPSNGTPAPADASAALVDLQVVSAQVLDVPAWKCQWNVTGTVLASSGDGGSVWMHRAADPFTDGQFVLVSTINPPGPPE